jgi:hypothetical protein
MHFLRFPQQRDIIALHGIHLTIFITATDCVYCEVRKEYLNTIQIKFGPQNATLQSVDTLFEYQLEEVVIETSWFCSVSPTGCWDCRSRQ